MFRLTFETISEEVRLLRQSMGRYSELKENPFLGERGRRPLRLTFDTVSFDQQADQQRAIELLRSFCSLPEIECFETVASASVPLLTVSQNDDGLPDRATMQYPDGRPGMTILTPAWYGQSPVEFAGDITGYSADAPETQPFLRAFTLAYGSKAYADLFVSTSVLVGHRDHSAIRSLNPVLPSEAARIAGIYLRSRGVYVIQAASRTGRLAFYLALARARLPNMWRYFSATLQAEEERGDDTGRIGQSILERLARAYRARDEIARQFYLDQNWSTRFEMIYHFDYLNLVLAGAFDSQARIAHRSYNLPANRERRANFRQDDWLQALYDAGAVQLTDLVRRPENQALLEVLFRTRNTIHGANLPAVGHSVNGTGEVESSRVWFQEQEEVQSVDRVSAARGGDPRWGIHMRTSIGTLIEPYQFAQTLIDDSVALLDELASTTDVVGLLPAGVQPRDWLETAPEDEQFGAEARATITLLG